MVEVDGAGGGDRESQASRIIIGGDRASWGFRRGAALNINCKDVCSRNHIILPFDPMR